MEKCAKMKCVLRSICSRKNHLMSSWFPPWCPSPPDRPPSRGVLNLLFSAPQSKVSSWSRNQRVLADLSCLFVVQEALLQFVENPPFVGGGGGSKGNSSLPCGSKPRCCSHRGVDYPEFAYRHAFAQKSSCSQVFEQTGRTGQVSCTNLIHGRESFLLAVC